MRAPLTVMATATIAAMLIGVSACGNDSTSSTPSSSSTTSHPPITDYTTLLIKATDIHAPDAFTAGPAVRNPNGQPGAVVTFTDSDHTHTIVDTIQIFPDADATASALDSAKSAHRESLMAKSLRAEVGVGGVTISGLSQDRSQGVTVLLFSEERVVVTLEFQGPSFALAPTEFVTEVGQKQDDLVKNAIG